MEELYRIFSERKDGVVYEVNIADADRFKFMEGRIESCLSEIFKAKEQFEDTLNKKLDCAQNGFLIDDKGHYIHPGR